MRVCATQAVLRLVLLRRLHRIICRKSFAVLLIQQAFALTISLPAQARSRLSLRAIRAPSLSAQGMLGCSDRMSPLRYDNAFAAPYDTSSGVIIVVTLKDKEIV